MLEKILQYKWWLLSIFILIYAYLGLQALKNPKYSAQATMIVQSKYSPTSLENKTLYSNQQERLLRMHMELMKSSPVLERVVIDIKNSSNSALVKEPLSDQMTIEKISNHISITSPVFTNLINVQVNHQHPRLAAQLANALISSYQMWYVELKQKEAGQIIFYLDQEIESKQQELQELKSKSKADKGQVMKGLIHDIKNLFEDKKKAMQYKTKSTTENLIMAAPATIPLQPSGRKKDLLIAAIISLSLSVSITFVIIYFDYLKQSGQFVSSKKG